MTWSWQVLRAGTLRLDGGGMFGVVPKVLWSKLIAPDDHNRIELQTNCLLLQRDGVNVLIETGFGDKWPEKERHIYQLQSRTVLDALHEVGVAPADVHHVIVTHLHFDHAAGLTRNDASGQPVSSFPNAVIHVQETEWNDALSNRSTMTRTYLREHLDPIADQVLLHAGEAEVFEGAGIHVWPMPGHTWGQQAVRFTDAKGTVVFPGDVMPTVHHVGLAFSIGYDMEPYTNMLSKQALLTQAEAAGWRIAIDHEPGPPVVTVARDPDRPDQFRLSPIDPLDSP